MSKRLFFAVGLAVSACFASSLHANFLKLEADQEQVDSKDSSDKKTAKKVLAYFKISEPIANQSSQAIPFFRDGGTSLRDMCDRLEKAANDENVKAVLITLHAGAGFNLAQTTELRQQLDLIRSKNKRVFIYADSYGTGEYLLASGCSDICMLEAGELFIPGIGIETMFYKGLFDKVGITADYIQVGEFKGAQEPFTRSEPTDELKGELDKLTRALFDEITNTIATARKKDPTEVRKLIDQAMIPADQLKKEGFIDHVVGFDGLRDLIDSEVGEKLSVDKDYGEEDEEKFDFSNPFSFLAKLGEEEPESTDPKIALIYADGAIVDGSGGSSFFGGSNIGGDTIRKAVRDAAKDDTVKAIVIRIDSPGGSALASEVMYGSVRAAAKDKPILISIGSMAASGGYYLACAGDEIWSDPNGIVGSIGVVGGKMVLGGLYEKLGLTTHEFTQGANANLFSSNETWSPEQRAMVEKWMTRTYKQFTDRVMSTRKGKIKDIDLVARGRIFTARQGHELGMVDHLGSLNDTISAAANKVQLKDDEYEIKVFPKEPTLMDMLTGNTEARTPVPAMSLESHLLLKALSPAMREGLQRQLSLAEMLQSRPVVLVSPYVIDLK
ncbi:MAG TPA: signal peptide peptidase SppA [Tepidisphaeraceae bacterium]|nr:signal peptide peptidase SppA [Tepidisphaeraceae bacterium]